MVVALRVHGIVSVWFPVLINRWRIAPIDLASIVTGLKPCVDIDSQENLNCTWIDTCSGNCYGVKHLLQINTQADRQTDGYIYR